MNRLTRAYVQFYWNSNRDVLLSKDTEHHTDIIEGLRKKDAATVIEFIRLDLHNFGGFEDFFLQARYTESEKERYTAEQGSEASLPGGFVS